jgi:hypothetical protein
MESAMGKRSGAKLAVVIAAAVLLLLLLAAPAMAAPFATSLVASPSLSTVALGDTLTISATLTDTDNTLPVGGETVRVEQATSNSGPWSLTDLVSTDVTTGVASYDAILTQTTYFRFVFEGTGTYAAATSNVLTVLVTPFATSLVASPSLSTVNVGDDLTISAVLTDTDNSLPVDGELVRVEQSASTTGPWSLVNYADNEGASGTYSLEFYPAQTAYYRFVYEGTDTYSPSTSNVISVVVTPIATSLTASPSQTTLNHGDGLTLSAVLTETDGGLPIGGAALRVESATGAGGPWSLVQTVSNDGTTGNYSLAVVPPRTTYYRFVYEGTDTYAAVTSSVLTVNVTPVPTSLTASPSQTTLNYGAGLTISATLTETDGGLPIGGAAVRVESATSAGGPWSLVQTVSNDGTTGDYSLAVSPARTMFYRFVFAGTDAYAAVTSDVLTVEVKPVLGTPTSPSSIKKNKSFTVKVAVKPGAPDGPAVKIQAYRKHDGKWSKYKSAYSTTRSGTTCSAKIKISATGQFKFKATVATSAKFVGVTSSYSKVMKVKK